MVIATIVMGLRQATCIPFSDHDRAMCHVVAIVAAALIIAGLGWLMTFSLSAHSSTTGGLSSAPDADLTGKGLV